MTDKTVPRIGRGESPLRAKPVVQGESDAIAFAHGTSSLISIMHVLGHRSLAFTQFVGAGAGEDPVCPGAGLRGITVSTGMPSAVRITSSSAA